MATSESRVKKGVKAILKSKGCYFFMPVQMGYGMPSVDFLVCWRGRFIAIETKAIGVKVVTARQQLTMNEITAAGGITLLVNDLQQLLDLFEMLETSPR